MSERVYCSELARAAAEPLAGTAEQVQVWVLIEYREQFRQRALEDNVLSAAVNAWIDSAPERIEAATGEYARMQFISQARGGRQNGDAGGLRLYVARAEGNEGRLFAVDLARHEDLAALDPVALARGEAPLESVDERLYLVCTNGQRDVCCARFGLPVYEHLVSRFGGSVWQTTHIGGHRYAPNVVCLPSGAVYGFAMRDVVDVAVDADRADELHLELLRGRSWLPTEAQVGEHVLRGSGNLRSIAALRFVGSTPVGERHHRVAFIDADGRRRVAEVWHEVDEIIVQASCGENGRKPIYRWHGTELADQVR